MSIPSWAVKGADVVCIDDSRFLSITRNPKKGDVLTIEDIDFCLFGRVGLTFVGFDPDDVFWVCHFAPVTSQNTEAQAEDVAMIKSLVSTKIEERA